jgi:hypothetical protein
MVYDVRVTLPGGSPSRFEYEHDDALKVGSFFNPGTMVYKVMRILPDETDRFDAVVEADWMAGPAQAQFIR